MSRPENETGESEVRTPSNNEGIYVLRTTQQNQVQLNLMADQKANIIIGVSLIFFTIAQRQLVDGLSENSLLLVPIVMLAVTMLASFFLAVLVVAPRFRPLCRRSARDLPNPLFFGYFPGSPEDDYIEFMQGQLDDLDRLREMFIRDIYQTGAVLRRKYRFLRFAYLFLATGVLVTGLAGFWLFWTERAG